MPNANGKAEGDSPPKLAPSLMKADHRAPTLSPRTSSNRLRKLQSAHNLGADARRSIMNPGSSNGNGNGGLGVGSGIGGGSSNGQTSLITRQLQYEIDRHQQQQEQQEQQEQQHYSNNSSGANVTMSPTTIRQPTPLSRRSRANSDAPSPSSMASSNAYNAYNPYLDRQRNLMSRASASASAISLERLIRDGPPDGDVRGALESMRLKVLDQGVKSDSDGMSSIRIYVWLILLDAPVLPTDSYLALVHRGPSPAYSKIRNDTFRTLTTDPLFRRRVSEASLIRLLNAIAWKLHDARQDRRPEDRRPMSTAATRSSFPSAAASPRAGQSPAAGLSPAASRPGTAHSCSTSPAARNRARAITLTEGSEPPEPPEPGTYVQGMNVLAAPFLYAARSEAEAFIAFHRLLTRECPAYIRGAMDGVHRGLALVDKVLAVVDAKLHLYLVSKNLSAEIYAFPSVLTLCACTPPLPEVLKLWDFLFAYGPHLNILCIVAQLIMMRNELLGSPSPIKQLRSFPPLQADTIKGTTLAIIKMLPDDIYAEIVSHAL